LGYFTVLILFLSGNEGRRNVCVWGAGGGERERRDEFYYVDMTGNFVYFEERKTNVRESIKLILIIDNLI